MSPLNRLALSATFAAAVCSSPLPAFAAETGAATAGATPGFVRLNSESDSAAWWTRVQFQADGEQVAGLPLHLIRADWCKANAFSREAFAAAVAPTPLWELPDATYELSTQFEGVGEVRVLVGVYEKCAGETGNFVLVLSRDTASPQVISVLEMDQGRPGFLALLVKHDGAIDLLYCFYCDHFGVLSWSPANRHLNVLPGPEVG